MALTRSDIRLVRSLARKQAREETGLFVAEGAKLVDELQRGNLPVRRLFTLGEGVPGAEPVTAAEMARLSHLKTPSDALALVEIPHPPFDPAHLAGELVLALDAVQNPGNLGTIIRLAEWFGIRTVLCSPSTADCFSPKVVQATMGSILRVRLHYLDLSPALDGLHLQSGLVRYGTFLDGEPLYRAPLTPHGVIVLGNEGQGISASLAARIDRRLFIPPFPAGRRTTESLNVAVAAAIVCSEFRRH